MRLKRISEILGRLIDVTLINTDELNDFTVGSTILSVYESIAMELEQYYVLTRENIIWGIEKGVLEAFDFNKREAKRAYGEVTIEFYTPLQTDIFIPRGTSFASVTSSYQQQYETLEDFVVPKGNIIAKVDVYCTQTGEVGNVPRGIINFMMNSINNVKSVYNERELLTGTEEESIESVKSRFHLFVESRGRATVKAVEYGARLVEEVSGVYVREEVGYVKVYAHDRNGDLSPAMIAQIKEQMEDYRPAGIKLDVFPVIKTEIPLAVTVTISNKSKINKDLEDRIRSTITNYLNNMTVSQDLILADVIQVIMNIDDNLIYDCVITNYTENVITVYEEIIRSGDISIKLV